MGNSKVLERATVLVATEEDSAGAAVIEHFLDLEKKLHSDKRKITILENWEQCAGGKVATVRVHVVATGEIIICDCFIGDMNAFIQDRHSFEKTFIIREDDRITNVFSQQNNVFLINRSKGTSLNGARKRNVAQMIIAAAIKRCGEAKE